MVVGRFAPSPTGRMHLGNAFAALLAWLSARVQGGRVLLRMEDLDPQRSRPEYMDALREDLAWLGLDWDAETPPQSGRTAFYEATLAQLRQKGLVYPCFCSRAQLHAASAPHAGQAGPVYSGRCARLAPGQAARLAQSRPAALRLRVPDEEISFTDGCQGPYTERLAAACGDFIIRRSDGVFAYQLATPADDGAQGITEVVRGRDLLASTPRQIWLLRTLGYAAPRYCHVPVLLAPDGRRLAKRDKDLDLGALRAAGHTPQAVVGALAHAAGLLPARQPVPAQELLPHFCWAKVHRQDIVIPPDFI